MSKILCVARNYAAHAAELANPIPAEPFFFLKPWSSALFEGEGKIRIPEKENNAHHEVELGVFIGTRATRVSKSDAMSHVSGYCCAIDVTGRDMQTAAKAKGHPWTEAKGYDTFMPISSTFDVDDPSSLEVWLKVNGEDRQRDSTSLMLFGVPELIE